MKTVVFHLQAKTCEKDISKLKEEILSVRENGYEATDVIAISETYFNMADETVTSAEIYSGRVAGSILAITDQFSDVDYAKEHNIAVIFYETPGTNRSVSGVDMVVQGFEELNVEYLQLIYMRHHGLPWIIAKTDRICIRESVEGDLTAFRKLYQEEGMLDYLPNPEFEGEEGRENFRHYIRSMYRFYNYGIWTVLERKSGAIIGRVGIENGEYQGENVLELGYLIGKDWRRQGFAREAVSMTERFAAEVLQADSLHAFIHPQNESSIAFIKAIGYEKLELPGEDGVLVWQKNLQKGRI